MVVSGEGGVGNRIKEQKERGFQVSSLPAAKHGSYGLQLHLGGGGGVDAASVGALRGRKRKDEKQLKESLTHGGLAGLI